MFFFESSSRNVEVSISEEHAREIQSKSEENPELERYIRPLARKLQAQEELNQQLAQELQISQDQSAHAYRENQGYQLRIEQLALELENQRAINQHQAQELQNVQNQLAQNRQELQTSRAFVAAETDDGKAVSEALERINRLVDDFAYRLIKSLPGDIIDQPIQKHHSGDSPSMCHFLERARQANATVADALMYVIQHEISFQLRERIFFFFAAGCELKIESDYLAHLYHSILQAGPQSHSARWRSMAYQQLSRKVNGAKVVTGIISRIDQTLRQTCKYEQPNNLAPELEAILSSIVNESLSLQEKIMVTYTSCEYRVYHAQPGSHVSPASMSNVDDSKGEGARTGIVLLGISLGLYAYSMEPANDNIYKPSAIESVVKTMVLTDSWMR